MTINQAIIERQKLINELDLYLEQKEINFIKTQPKSPIVRDVIEGKSDGFRISDKFTHYIIKDEKFDLKIFTLQKEINSIEKYIINEMERINKAGGDELIKFYRHVLGYSWEKTARITHYSVRQCQRKIKENKRCR